MQANLQRSGNIIVKMRFKRKKSTSISLHNQFSTVDHQIIRLLHEHDYKHFAQSVPLDDVRIHRCSFDIASTGEKKGVRVRGARELREQQPPQQEGNIWIPANFVRSH